MALISKKREDTKYFNVFVHFYYLIDNMIYFQTANDPKIFNISGENLLLFISMLPYKI